jgi:hypothetical protein
VRIYADNRRTSKYIAICSGAGLLGLLVGRASWWVGAPIAVLFFGLTVLLVRGAVSRPPQITIDEEGLGGAELPRELAWAEIATILHTTRSARYSKTQVLRITPHGGQAFEISLSNMLTPPARIVEEVERYHEVV